MLKEKWEKLSAKLLYLWQNYSFLLVAFIIPLLLQWMIFIAMEVWPFGTSSVLVLDLNGQYVYFFEDLKRKVLEGGSLVYTWSRALGGENMGIYAYYLASPFSFLICLFSENHTTEFLLLMELLKTGCMGATMAFYLHKARKSRPINAIIFSTCYAMSAYAVVYGHNTMWIDCVILLPLLTLGIESLIKEKKFILFVFSLAMSLLTSFYIGYMVCIYTAIYFFYYYIAHDNHSENNFWLEDNHFWKSLGRIAFFSAIAISIAMIIVWPAYTSLQFGKNTFSTVNWNFGQRFDLLDFMVKLFPGSYDTVRPEGLPVVYCGTVMLLLVPMYFLSSKIRWQERLMGGVILLVFLLSFNTHAIDVVWHGFQKPNWLNYRYSFMFIFLTLVMAYKAFTTLESSNYKYLAIFCGVYVILLMFIQKQDYEFLNDFSCIWLSVLCVIAFTVALFFVKSNNTKGLGAIIVAAFCCLELFGAGLLNLIALDDDVVISRRTSYNDFMDKARPSVEWVKEHDQSEFYRMEKDFHRKVNDPMTLGFYGISNSTSTLNKSVIDLLHSYGYASKSHWSKYLGGNPVSDSLLNIKYVVSKELSSTDIMKNIHVDSDNGYTVFENLYVLSLAYAADGGLADFEITDYKSAFRALNALTQAIAGSEYDGKELFKELTLLNTDMTNVKTGFTTQHRKYSKEDEKAAATIEYTVAVKGGVPVYMNIPTDYPREAKLKVNGSSRGYVLGNETDRIISIGTFDEDCEITVTIELQDDPIYIMTNQDYFFYLDEELFKEMYSDLRKGNLNITKFEDTHIEGDITVPEGKELICTSIPYDKGWHILVDGEEKELIKVEGALIAVEAGAGHHTVEMTYCPDCYKYGGIISICGVIVYLVCIGFYIYGRRREKKRWIAENPIY